MTAGQRPPENNRAALDQVAQQKKDDGAAMRRDGLQQQQRGQRVQAIALCKKLGLNYSTKNNSPAPCRRKRLIKPPPPPTLPSLPQTRSVGVEQAGEGPDTERSGVP